MIIRDRELLRYAICAILIIIAIVALILVLGDNIKLLFDTGNMKAPASLKDLVPIR